jgi:hypothetical protein
VLAWLKFKSFFETPTYKWLIANIERECLTPSNPNLHGRIKIMILDSLYGRYPFSPLIVTYKCNWDLMAFLREQGYKEEPATAIKTSITLTGSDVSAQAQTCIQYLCQTWPSTGLVLLYAPHRLQRVLHIFDHIYRLTVTTPRTILLMRLTLKYAE